MTSAKIGAPTKTEPARAAKPQMPDHQSQPRLTVAAQSSAEDTSTRPKMLASGGSLTAAATEAPRSGGASSQARVMRAMQGTVGNARTIQRLAFDRDSIESRVQRQGPPGSIQRKCACGGDAGTDGECSECKAQRFAVQRQAAAPDTPDTLPPSVTSALQAGGGQPLDHPTRSRMESAFGAEFGGVRVHNGTGAASAARDLDAKAFSAGRDIYFGNGYFQPNTPNGQGLLAHELAHTIQQKNGAVSPQARRWVSHPDDPSEREAESIAGRINSYLTPGLIQAGITGEADAPAIIQRQGLAPANEAAWDWYASTRHRRDPSFLQTVAAAPEVANELNKGLVNLGAPRTKEERAVFDKRMLKLIQLNAIAMVGEHRRQLAERKQQFDQMAGNPKLLVQPAGGSGGGANPAAADTAAAIRAAAQTVVKLNTTREHLQNLRTAIDRAVRVNAGPDALNDEYQTLWESAQPHSSAAILRRLLAARGGQNEHSRAWGRRKMQLLNLRNYLLRYRDSQIQALDLSVATVYEAFPFLADLPTSTITSGRTKSTGTSSRLLEAGLGATSLVLPLLGPLAGFVAQEALKNDVHLDDKALLAEVQRSFDRLLERTDEAIVKVGAGSIDPLDLPGAVAATRKSLPTPLQTELDRIKQDHEVMKWATEMVMVLGVAVLTGLTGGAASLGYAGWAAAGGATAAGIGAAQLGQQFKDMKDRQTLAAASTNPEGSLLGVSAPSMFEWTMLGIGAVLVAVDLAGVVKEIKMLRPQFNEGLQLPHGQSEPQPVTKSTAGSKREVEPQADHQREAGLGNEPKPAEPHDLREPAVGSDVIRPKNPGEARVLEAGRGDAVPTPEQLDAELAIVEQTPPRKLPGSEYVEEVELPNKHTWQRRADGTWCRSSNRLCGIRGSSGTAKQRKATIQSEADIDRLIEPHRPHLNQPPAHVILEDEKGLWELYNEYFAERVAKMRSDIRELGENTRDLPLDFDGFRKRYSESPALVRALRGRLAQARVGNVLDELSAGKVGQNLGVSKVPNPAPGDVVFPDFVWRSENGFTAISNKSRDFRKMSDAAIKKTVLGDVDEALGKYCGRRWVRREGIELSGQEINIDEVILNYDPALIPESIRADIFSYARDHGGAGIDVSFFQFK